MKTIGILLLLIIEIIFNNYAVGQSLSARDIEAKSIEATRISGTEKVAVITTINKDGQKRIRKLASMTKLYDNGSTEKKLIRFISPADVKGIGFLTYDYNEKGDDKWIFMPALRKTRRIISSENAKSFMGTEFSYADMTIPNIDDFDYQLTGKEEVMGEQCYVIEIKPKNEPVQDENGFSRKIVYISMNTFVKVKSIYFDTYGDKEKVLLVKKYEELDKINHKYSALYIEISNVQTNRKSINEIIESKFNPKIPDQYFTIRYLEQ